MPPKLCTSGAATSLVAAIALYGQAILAQQAQDSEVDRPRMTAPRTDLQPFEYVDAKIAYYPPGGDRRGGGDWNKMQVPLSPEESLKHYVMPEGFRLELFAAEPQIGKPICMNWDERGRLWIAETVDYPNEKRPDAEGRDRIRICEDTDGDGRADKFTVFAEQLSIPTSLTFSRGGIIVHQAPQTLFLQDTDGDDRADVRQVLIDGWGTRDTHAGPNNLQYGLDNWIGGMVGYSGFEGEVGGERHRFVQGFYRFRPDGSKLEFLRSTNNNTWGIGFSEEGLVFGSTANRNPSVYLPIPNRYYESVRGWSAGQLGGIADTHLFQTFAEKVRQVDHHGGYTAAAGHALYTARTYPQTYWNRLAFVTEPTGHLVGVFVLERDGSDFHSSNRFNLLASDDEWAAPIMAEVGPDGNVWVIDWYNYIVQHNPTPVGFETGPGNAYETDLRDKKHGRIYRLVYGADQQAGRFSLQDATPEQLVETLRHPNLFWRRHAQRLLVERGDQDVVPRLIELARDPGADEIGLNVGVIHALWTLHGLGVLDGERADATVAATGALAHRSAGVRRNAALVLPRTAESATALLDSGLLEDADSQVKLAALLALSEMPADGRAGQAVAAFLRKPENANDRWLPDAATSAAAAHDLHFLKAIAAGEPVQSANLTAAVGVVAGHYARGAPTNSVGEVLAVLADGNPASAETVVAGLARGWPKETRADLDPAANESIDRLLNRLTTGGKGQLITLAMSLGSNRLEPHAKEIASKLIAAVADEQQSGDARIAAARQLIQFRPGDAEVVQELMKVVTPRIEPALAAGIIASLESSTAAELGSALIDRLPELPPSAGAAVMRVLLSRADSARALLEAIDSGKVQWSDLTLDQRQALAVYPDRRVAFRARDLLRRGGGLPNADRQLVLDELMPLAKQTGDVERGKLLFKNQCAKCHTHSGEGTKVGPDLTGMAVHPKEELLTHIIDPSRSVEGNYRAYTVVTQDGRVLIGMLASETRTSIELFDSEGKQQAILREEIDALSASSKSIMPEGFEKQVKPEELVDLLEFLSAKGRFLPLPLEKAATVVTTKAMFHSGENGPDRLIFDDWKPKTAFGVPFQVIDPGSGATRNAILLNGPNGTLPPKMPQAVRVPCNTGAKAVHLLSGVSGWGYPLGRAGSVSMIVRLHYADGQAEDYPLLNGEHFADYIRRVDVPKSQLAFMLRGQQLRYLAIEPQRDAVIKEIEFRKGDDQSAPIVMAATVEVR
ncbi:MAG: c-type cytochrome [Planctomycetes bacterium]|nr:c-type cytochrome [Planctomycetota bacterium]